MTNFSTSKYIKIIDKVALSQNKYLLIVQVNNKNLLLSVTDNNINILRELEDIMVDDKSEPNNLNSDVRFSEILKENLLKSKITSKLMKGNISNESDKFNKKEDK